MNVYQPIVKYKSFNNSIVFPERIAIGLLPDFSAAIQIWNERKRKNELWLDFSAVQKAYANGMLGIIASVNELRRQGITNTTTSISKCQKFFLSDKLDQSIRSCPKRWISKKQ